MSNISPHILNINLDSFEIEKDLTWCVQSIIPSHNLYDIIFSSPSLSKLEYSIVSFISSTYNLDYSVYLRRIQGYIQTEETPNLLTFPKVIKSGLIPTSEFSFVYLINANETILKFKTGDLSIKDKELILFKTENFIADLSECKNRRGLVGGLTNKLNKQTTELLI